MGGSMARFRKVSSAQNTYCLQVHLVPVTPLLARRGASIGEQATPTNSWYRGNTRHIAQGLSVAAATIH